MHVDDGLAHVCRSIILTRFDQHVHVATSIGRDNRFSLPSVYLSLSLSMEITKPRRLRRAHTPLISLAGIYRRVVLQLFSLFSVSSNQQIANAVAVGLAVRCCCRRCNSTSSLEQCMSLRLSSAHRADLWFDLVECDGGRRAVSRWNCLPRWKHLLPIVVGSIRLLSDSYVIISEDSIGGENERFVLADAVCCSE